MDIGVGQPLPLGVTATCDGFNFTVFSRHATAVSLLIFDDSGNENEPIAAVSLDAIRNRTGDVWHVALSRDMSGKSYAWSVAGPWAPSAALTSARPPVLASG
jgi:isoamylase